MPPPPGPGAAPRLRGQPSAGAAASPPAAGEPHARTAPSVQLPATPGRAGRKSEGGRKGGREGAAIKPAPAKPFPAAGGGRPALPVAYARPAPRPPPPLLPGRRRRCRRPGGARCLHLRRVAPLPTGSPLFHSRLQRRSKSSGAHIGEGKGGEGGTSARATRAHPTRRSQPRRRGRGARPLHAAAIGKSAGTALGFSCAPRLLSSWLEEERESADVSVLGAGPLPPPPPPVPC